MRLDDKRGHESLHSLNEKNFISAAAGADRGGYDSIAVYEVLYGYYKELSGYFGEKCALMSGLKTLKG
jgi:hypothetical protein